MYTVDYTSEWNFGVDVEGSHYDITWEKAYIVEIQHTDYFLTVKKDKEGIGEFDKSTRFVKDAAIGYRVSQLQEELRDRISFYDDAAVKDAIVELYERSSKGEYLGQYSDKSLYTETVAKIFGTSLAKIHELVAELVEEERIGVNGFILISHEEYRASKKSWEDIVGHKTFSRSDLPDGRWGCDYCGASGWLDEVDPATVACEKDAYRDKDNR